MLLNRGADSAASEWAIARRTFVGSRQNFGLQRPDIAAMNVQDILWRWMRTGTATAHGIEVQKLSTWKVKMRTAKDASLNSYNA
jgi:hypothetical protein